MSLSFLGLSCSRIWTTAIFVLYAVPLAVGLGPAVHLNAGTVLFFATGGAFALAAAAACRTAARLLERWGRALLLACGLCASLLLIVGSLGGNDALLLAGLCSGGLTLALFRLEWGRVWGGMDKAEAGLHTALSFALAFAVVLALKLLPPAATYAVLPLLPVVSVACLVRARRCWRVDEDGGAHEASAPTRSFIPLALSIFAFVFASVVLRGVYAGGAGASWVAQWQSTAVDGSVALLFTVLYLVFKDMDVVRVYRWVLPLMAVGYTLAPLLPDAHQIAGPMLAAIGYGLFDLLSWIVMARYVHDGRADAMRVFGLGVGATMAGRACGTAVGAVLEGLVEAGLVAFSSISLVMVFLLIVVCALVLPERSLGALAAGGFSDGAAAPACTGEDPCDVLAQAGGLTPRETDVLHLLARGRNAQVIGRELSIATGTVQAHVKHVYAKLGVHTQQELIDLVEGRGERHAADSAGGSPRTSA